MNDASIIDSLFDFEGELENVLFLTYTFDSIYFQEQVLTRIKDRGRPKITVVMDAHQYKKTIREKEGRFSLSYNLTKYQKPNLFHCKLYVLLGRNKARILIGSANLTKYGFENQAELFSTIDFDVDNNGLIWKNNILHGVLEVLRDLSSSVPNTSKERIKSAILRLKMFLGTVKLSESPTLIQNTKDKSIMKVIEKYVEPSYVQKIIVISPFFENETSDYGLFEYFLKNNKMKYKKLKSFQVYFRNQEGCHSLPLQKLRKYKDEIKYYDLDVDGRPLHGKALVLYGKKCYVLFGSANFTLAAMLRSLNNKGNVETCLLLEFPLKEGNSLVRNHLLRRKKENETVRLEDIKKPVEPIEETYSAVSFIEEAIYYKDKDLLKIELDISVVSNIESIEFKIFCGNIQLKQDEIHVDEGHLIQVINAQKYLFDLVKNKYSTTLIKVKIYKNGIWLEDVCLAQFSDPEEIEIDGTFIESKKFTSFQEYMLSLDRLIYRGRDGVTRKEVDSADDSNDKDFEAYLDIFYKNFYKGFRALRHEMNKCFHSERWINRMKQSLDILSTDKELDDTLRSFCTFELLRLLFDTMNKTKMDAEERKYWGTRLKPDSELLDRTNKAMVYLKNSPASKVQAFGQVLVELEKEMLNMRKNLK